MMLGKTQYTPSPIYEHPTYVNPKLRMALVKPIILKIRVTYYKHVLLYCASKNNGCLHVFLDFFNVFHTQKGTLYTMSMTFTYEPYLTVPIFDTDKMKTKLQLQQYIRNDMFYFLAVNVYFGSIIFQPVL